MCPGPADHFLLVPPPSSPLLPPSPSPLLSFLALSSVMLSRLVSSYINSSRLIWYYPVSMYGVLLMYGHILVSLIILFYDLVLISNVALGLVLWKFVVLTCSVMLISTDLLVYVFCYCQLLC